MVQDVASQFGRTKHGTQWIATFSYSIWLYDRYNQSFTVKIIRRDDGLIAEIAFLDMMSGISMVDELHQTVRAGYIHVSYCMISNYLSMHAMVKAAVQHIFWTAEQPTSVMRTV